MILARIAGALLSTHDNSCSHHGGVSTAQLPYIYDAVLLLTSDLESLVDLGVVLVTLFVFLVNLAL